MIHDIWFLKKAVKIRIPALFLFFKYPFTVPIYQLNTPFFFKKHLLNIYYVHSLIVGAVTECQRTQESDHRKEKKHLNSRSCSHVPQAASALLAVSAQSMAGIQILSQSRVASASSVYSAAGPGSTLSAPAFSHDPTGTSGSSWSEFPPRWLQITF